MLYKTFKRWWRLYFTIKISSAIDYTEGKQGDRRYHWFHVGVDKRPLGDDYVMSRLILVLPWVAFGVGIVPPDAAMRHFREEVSRFNKDVI